MAAPPSYLVGLVAPLHTKCLIDSVFPTERMVQVLEVVYHNEQTRNRHTYQEKRSDSLTRKANNPARVHTYIL